MRRIATISALAALLVGLPLMQAEARDRHRGGWRAFYVAPGYYYVPPSNPWAAWRAYYGAQADLSFARRAYRADFYVARGYNPPFRHRGRPTNYYAERYSLDPYAYFNCPLARRGEGVCAQPDFFSR